MDTFLIYKLFHWHCNGKKGKLRLASQSRLMVVTFQPNKTIVARVPEARLNVTAAAAVEPTDRKETVS